MNKRIKTVQLTIRCIINSTIALSVFVLTSQLPRRAGKIQFCELLLNRSRSTRMNYNTTQAI